MEYDRALYRVYERILDDLQASEPVLSSAAAGASSRAAAGGYGPQSGPSLPYFLPLQCAHCLDTALDALVYSIDGNDDGVENATSTSEQRRRRRFRRVAATATHETAQVTLNMCRHALRRVRIRMWALVRGPGGLFHGRIFGLYNYESVPRSLSDLEVTSPDTIADEEIGGTSSGGGGGGVELTNMAGRVSSDGLRRRGRNAPPVSGSSGMENVTSVEENEDGGDTSSSSNSSASGSSSSSDDGEDGLMDADVEGQTQRIPTRMRRDEAGLVCTQKGVYAFSRAAAFWGYVSLFILYCLHTTYVGAGVTTHSGVAKMINSIGRILSNGDQDRLTTCIEHALATRPIEERRKLAYFDHFGDNLDDDATSDEDDKNTVKKKKEKGKSALRGASGKTKKGYYMKSVDTGEEGTMTYNQWFGGLFSSKNGQKSSNASSATITANVTEDMGDPPLLGRDEILQIKILYGGTCHGQCSRVRNVVYLSHATNYTSSNRTKSSKDLGDDDADPLLERTTDQIVGSRGMGNSSWTTRGLFRRKSNADASQNQTSGIDRLSSPEFWKKPHYRFASDDALIYLDHRSSVLHRVNVVNVTVTERCLSSGTDQGTLSITGYVGEFLAQVFGMDTPVINQMMYGIRSNDGKYRNGHLVNIESKEHWTWRRKQMEFYDIQCGDVFSWLSRKLGIVSLSMLTFFLLTSVTSVIVRVLTTSGVVLMFPVFTFFRLLGVPGADERLLGLSYPWIGRARNAVIRRRVHPPAHLIAAHGAKIFLFYLMYEACQAAWSAVLYGKSIPSGLQIYIFGFCMIWEYYAMVFCRSALSVHFFPRILLFYFVLYHVYFLSTPYPWLEVALVPWFLFLVQAMAYSIIALEVPAAARGAMSVECPREVYNRLAWAEWSATVPQIYSLFLPLNSRHTPLYDREVSDVAEDTSAPASERNDNAG